MTMLKRSRGTLLLVGLIGSFIGLSVLLWSGSGLLTNAQGGSALTIDALVNPLDAAIAGGRGEAVLLVTVQSNSGRTAGLTQADFTVDTDIVPSGAGTCPLAISQFFGQFKPGIYLFGLTPVAGCVWAKGEYDITLIVSSDGKDGVGLLSFSIVK